MIDPFLKSLESLVWRLEEKVRTDRTNWIGLRLSAICLQTPDYRLQTIFSLSPVPLIAAEKAHSRQIKSPDRHVGHEEE